MFYFYIYLDGIFYDYQFAESEQEAIRKTCGDNYELDRELYTAIKRE